jgi:hypothetical protein
MHVFARIVLMAAACVGISLAGVYWLTRPMARTEGHRARPRPSATETADRSASARSSADAYPSPTVPTFEDPTAPGTSARVFVDPALIDTSVFSTVAWFMEPSRADRSLKEWREVIGSRSSRAFAQLQAEHDRLQLDTPPTAAQAMAAIRLERDIAFVLLYDGKYAEAIAWLERGRERARTPGVATMARAHMTALLGIASLRRGEQDNCIACVGPSSCIFPISRQAVHTRPEGSREAIRWFTEYLDEWPGDLRIRWLLNIAYMTLGEYPEHVPPRFVIATAPFQSGADLGRFENVAQRVGLGVRGPDLAGGSIFDDFDGDDRPDILTTTFDVAHGASLYLNRGDGHFEDHSEKGGLEDQVYALNVARGDYDNDGRPDVVLLRGGWEKPARLSLLRNRGSGAFEDVTVASGLGLPIATESAAWGDYDKDGRLDLFVCGEYLPPLDPRTGRPSNAEPDPRNHCRLYHNRGDGTFLDVADAAGVRNDRWAKGCAWGDYDNDGRLDLFVSNMDGPGRLYHNRGDGTFLDVAPELGIDGPSHGFTCAFWDHDNDGWLDLLVCDYGGSLAGTVADYMGLPVDDEGRPRLFRNLDGKGFRDVSREVGLTRTMPAMSMNVGDLDNDGFLDLHFGTGWMSISGLIPDVTYRNDGGRRFVDVTESTGTGHLQKGHGVSFADFDFDGDLDMLVVLGGGYPGDRGYNALFQNPGHGRHWLKVKLVGTRSNRSALGARLRVDLAGPDGISRSIHRMIGSNGSFGGNTLVETIGLLDTTSVARLTVDWPDSGTSQTFHDLAADRFIEIHEGVDSVRALRPEGGDAHARDASAKP